LSLRERLPTFSIDPVRTTIVNSSGFTNLAVLYNGSPISRQNVISVRVYFWNRGDLPIVKSNHEILRPIQLILQPEDAEILEVRALKQSRREVGFSAQVSHDNRSSVDLDFGILEKNDGAAIQLIYAGPEKVIIRPEGTIVGVNRIDLIQTYADRADMPFLERIKHTSILTNITFVYLFLLLDYAFNGIIFAGRSRLFRRSWAILGLAVAIALTIVQGVWRDRYSPLSDVPKQILQESTTQ
jgi:hypothetical protein